MNAANVKRVLIIKVTLLDKFGHKLERKHSNESIVKKCLSGPSNDLVHLEATYSLIRLLQIEAINSILWSTAILLLSILDWKAIIFEDGHYIIF